MEISADVSLVEIENPLPRKESSIKWSLLKGDVRDAIVEDFWRRFSYLVLLAAKSDISCELHRRSNGTISGFLLPNFFNFPLPVIILLLLHTTSECLQNWEILLTTSLVSGREGGKFEHHYAHYSWDFILWCHMEGLCEQGTVELYWVTGYMFFTKDVNSVVWFLYHMLLGKDADIYKVHILLYVHDQSL
jgi:hypothetical protein